MRGRAYAACLALLPLRAAAGQPRATQYDLVLQGGRVMDPESGLDAVRNIGIMAGRIEAVSPEPLQGKSVVDVSSLVVAPGFIDLHSHAWVRSQILEGDNAVAGFDALLARALTGGDGLSMERPSFREPLNDEQLVQLREHLYAGLDQGGLGIGMLLDYMSEVVSDEEMRVVFEVAAERGAPISVHVRRGVAGDPAPHTTDRDMTRFNILD